MSNDNQGLTDEQKRLLADHYAQESGAEGNEGALTNHELEALDREREEGEDRD